MQNVSRQANTDQHPMQTGKQKTITPVHSLDSFFSPVAWLGTTAFCLSIALLLEFLETGNDHFLSNLAISCSIGYSIHGFNSAGFHLFLGRIPAPVLMFILTPLGLVTGLAIAGLFSAGDALYFLGREPSAFILGTFFGLIGIVGSFAFANMNEAQLALANERRQRLEQEQETLSAELKIMQAQIEPHFLFNTLSNIRSLISSQPDDATRMLDQLGLMLRTSLQRTRSEAIPLRDELKFSESYLQIQQFRLGERLQWHIDVSDEAQQINLPPLLVQPLVENALTHGIEPASQGGKITVRAFLKTPEAETLEQGETELRIEVGNTGIGLSAASAQIEPKPQKDSSPHGTALQNIQKRLQLAYGNKASFRLFERNTSEDLHNTAQPELPQNGEQTWTVAEILLPVKDKAEP